MTQSPDQRRLIRSAYGVLQWLLGNLPKDFLNSNETDSVVLEALKQHGDHLAVHGIVQQNVDAFKLSCWLGGSMLKLKKGDDTACETIIDALLKTLRALLYQESEKFLVMPKYALALLKSFIIQQQKGNDKHGIWMNGLYVAFHCSLSSYRNGKSFKIPL